MGFQLVYRSRLVTRWRNFLTGHRQTANAVLRQARTDRAAAVGADTEVLARLADLEPTALRLGSQVSDAGPGAVEAVFISLIRLAGLRPSADDPVWGRLAEIFGLVSRWRTEPEELVTVLTHAAPGGSSREAWQMWLALAHALEEPGGSATRGTAVAATELAALASWRTGSVQLRATALRILARSPHAVLAPLTSGCAFAGDPAALSAACLADRWFWPGMTAPKRRTGGFLGFGGSWVSPPRLIGATDQAWWLWADDAPWVLLADVHGTAAVRMAPDHGPLSPREFPRSQKDGSSTIELAPDHARARVLSDSYLVEICPPPEGTHAKQAIRGIP